MVFQKWVIPRALIYKVLFLPISTFETPPPCERRPCPERSLLGQVLETVQAHDPLWIQDRNFRTCAFLGEIDKRGAGFITRQHEGLPFEAVTTLRPVGSIETGRWLSNGCRCAMPREAPPVRRIRVKLDQATRDGDRVLYILTNVPCARPRPNGWPDGNTSAGRWRPPSSSSKRTSSRKSIRWAIPRPPCSAFAWPWSPTICWRW